MKIFGIVNITDDSFSDGGLYRHSSQAIAHALQLHAGGAQVIDLGAASSNPHSGSIGEEEEIARLRPVIARLKEAGVSISADSFKPAVQRFCMAEGVDYLNDIQGFRHPELYPCLAQSACRLVLMHSIQRTGMATITESDPEEVFEQMMSFFAQRIGSLQRAGIARERLILDPGMGHFLGSNPESSLLALRQLPLLKAEFGLEVLVGVSRKSFLGNIASRPPQQRGAATLAAEIFAAEQGCDYIRTHDTQALHDALSVWRRLKMKD